MSTDLETYLHDHLAGAAFAIDLLHALYRKHETDSLSERLRPLLLEIERDREELVRVAVSFGCSPGGMKEYMARFMEKLSRPKLVNKAEDIFSSFEACETLALGILGKRALWDVLATLPGPAGATFDWDRLRARAESQHATVEKLRLDLAAVALGTGSFKS